MTDYQLLGKKISEARKHNSLSQEALDESTNISISTVQRIENGHVKPRAFTLKTITDTLGLSLQDLLVQCNQPISSIIPSSKKLIYPRFIFFYFHS